MRLLIRARNAVLGVEGGTIVEPVGRFDIEIDAPRCDIRPGLINAHDHLHRNHYGRLGRPPYRNAYDWAHDIQSRCRLRIAAGRRLSRRAALMAGAWKNLFAGVTSVVHHDRWEPDFDHDFPIRVVRLASADSFGMTPEFERPLQGPFGLHLAEGIDRPAAAEVQMLASRRMLDRRLIAVHGVGMDHEAVRRFRASGAALVWCPTSNHFLFGRTVSPALVADGIDVLLGSDSRLTGDGDLLDELRAAHSLGLMSNTRLEDSVGAVAARRLGLSEPSITPGSRADLILLAPPLLEASARDVALVLVEGVPRVAEASLAHRLTDHFPGGHALTHARTRRWVNPGMSADRTREAA